MACASATAISWRPLPPLRPSSSRSRTVALKDVAGHFAGTTSPCAPPRTRQTSCCCINNSIGSGWSSGSISNLLLRNSLSSPFLGVRRLKQSNSSKCSGGKKGKNDRGVVVTTRAGLRFDSGGGGNNNNEGGIGRLIVNVALAGGMMYLAVTGKLGWVFDTLVSLWLLAVLIPIVSFVAFLWFAEREIVKGACPNCGQTFQVFEFALKEQPNLCPYCSQPFKLDPSRQFVRDEPRFSKERSGGFGDVFGGFGRGSSSSRNEDPGGVIVDVEAEVVDRD